MRTAYKGTFHFGLLAIPIRMGTAMDTRASLFHHTHKQCSTRIKQKRWCPTCGVEVSDFSDVGKGVELADETMALISDEELDALRVWDNKTIKLIHFTPAAQVDVRLYDQTYYMEPVDGGGPAHALLLAAMGASEGLGAVCTVGYRDRAALALMVIRDGHFELTTLRWPSELRRADVTLPPVQPARAQEVKMATTLVRSLTRPFDPAEHTDKYRDALVGLVAAKAAGQPAGTPVPAQSTAGQYDDMMSLLQASIAETRAAKPKSRARRAPAA
jgi:DNA end-binding protein Ku